MSTNWINTYGASAPRRFQAGGPMGPGPAEMAPPAGGGGGADLEGMLMEYSQSRDPQLAVAIADSLLEMMASQGGGAPAGGPPPEGPPMARRGMRMSRAPIFIYNKKGFRLFFIYKFSITIC